MSSLLSLLMLSVATLSCLNICSSNLQKANFFDFIFFLLFYLLSFDFLPPVLSSHFNLFYRFLLGIYFETRSRNNLPHLKKCHLYPLPTLPMAIGSTVERTGLVSIHNPIPTGLNLRKNTVFSPPPTSEQPSDITASPLQTNSLTISPASPQNSSQRKTSALCLLEINSNPSLVHGTVKPIPRMSKKSVSPFQSGTPKSDVPSTVKSSQTE